MTRTLAMCQVPIVCTEVCQTPSTTKAEDMDFCSGRHYVFRGSVYVHYVSVWKGVHTTQQVFVAHSVQYFLVPCFVFIFFINIVCYHSTFRILFIVLLCHSAMDCIQMTTLLKQAKLFTFLTLSRGSQSELPHSRCDPRVGGYVYLEPHQVSHTESTSPGLKSFLLPLDWQGKLFTCDQEVHGVRFMSFHSLPGPLPRS